MTTPKNGITQAHHGWPREEAPTNGAGKPVAQTNEYVSEDDQRRRLIARAVGLSPEEPWHVIEARAQRLRDEHRKYQEAAAAFLACHEGHPSHAHFRHVCAVSGCDNGIRKDALCAKHYEAKQKEGG